MYTVNACVTACLALLTGNPDRGYPGWLSTQVSDQSYLNKRFFESVPAPDFLSSERGPFVVGVRVKGKATLSMGNLTQLNLDLSQAYLPMTTYAYEGTY